MRGWHAAIALLGLAVAAWGAEAQGPRRCSPAEVRARLAEILARPAYHNPLAKLAERLEALLMRVLRFLSEALEGLQGLAVTAPLLYWLIIAALVVVLVLLLTHIGYTVYRGVTMGSGPRLADDRADGAPPTPASLRSQAERLAAEGRHVDAIRTLFRALALELQRRGRSFVFTSLTNREFAAAFSDDPTVFDRLRTFVDLLDDRWYGQRPCDAKDYELCMQVYNQVLASARG